MRTFCLILITAAFVFSCTSPKAETQSQPEVTPTTPPQAKGLDAQLQGAWQSQDDSLYHIHFQGENYFSGYADQLDPASIFAIVDSCEGAASKGEYLKVSLEDGTPMCYSVAEITEDELELVYLSRGNRLKFFRK